MREKELIVYRDFEDGELLYDMAFLMSHYDDEYYNTEDMAALFYECIHDLDVYKRQRLHRSALRKGQLLQAERW